MALWFTICRMITLVPVLLVYFGATVPFALIISFINMVTCNRKRLQFIAILNKLNTGMEHFSNVYDQMWVPIWSAAFRRTPLYMYCKYTSTVSIEQVNELPAKPGENIVRIVVMADTHNKHKCCIVPDGDIFIHGGDILMSNSRLSICTAMWDMKAFNTWLGTLPHAHKIVIGGNHDSVLADMGKRGCDELFTNAVYLENSTVTIKGIKFWGYGWSPTSSSPNRAFFMSSAEAAALFAQIPDDVEILLTHALEGGDELEAAVQKLAPRLHIGGHFHCEHGISHPQPNAGLAVCASVCDGSYRPIQPIVVIDYLPRAVTTN